MHKNVDVLIVGAGPTGLAMALELAAQGISFRIVDKAKERSPYSRALAVQPRTFEIFNRHGTEITEEFLAMGQRTANVSMCVSGKKLVDINADDIELSGTKFPFSMAITQFETEHWLVKVLKKYDVQVEMATEAKKLTQDADGVTTILSTKEGGEEEIRSKYVVGADGAHSTVRHSATNITFDGDTYPQEFICADAFIDSQLPSGRGYVCLGQGALIVIPLKDGRSRLVVSRPGQDTTREPKLEDIQDFAQGGIFPGGISLRDAAWVTRFRLHHRGASSYRDGRLFVAGDASHIHSPAGGQGMNTGIQDAANLGWKMAAVLRGEKPDSFLDTYHNERHRVGQYLLKTTDRLFTYVTSTNPIFLFLRNLILPWLFLLFPQNKALVGKRFQFISQLRIRYRKSDIVGTADGFDGPIKGGDRAVDGKIKGPEGEMWFLDLLGPKSHYLMLFSGCESHQASEGELNRAETSFLDATDAAVKVNTILSEEQNGQAGYIDLKNNLHKEFGFSRPGYVLIRPDGYIAHIGPLARIKEAAEWL
ncbi:FAD binding domain-containing protein [Nemania sp. FL0916]|nr:FAD binding domain-containing protein [Nemania sp. FL0916]